MPIAEPNMKNTFDAEAGAPVERKERFQTSRVVTISTGHIVHDTYTAFLPPLLPIFIAGMSLSKFEAGLLTVFTQAPSMVQPVFGHLADRSVRNHLVFLAPALTAVTMSLLNVAPSYAALALLLTLAGISSAVFHAVAPVIAGKLSGRMLGRGMSYWMVGGELGRALGPIVIVTTIRFFTLRSVPWLMVLGLAVALFLYVRLRDIHIYTRHTAKGLPLRVALHRMKPVMLPLVGFIFLGSFAYAALTIYLPIFLTEKGSTLWVAGASLSLLEGAGVVGAFLGGSISDHLGRRRVLFISTLATPLFLFALLATRGWIQFPILLFLGFTLLSTTPVAMALVQEMFPENRALANGMFMALNFVLRSGGVVLLGWMGDFWGLHRAFFISGFLMILSLPFISVLPKSRSR